MCSLISNFMTEFEWLVSLVVFLLWLVVSLFMVLDMYEKYCLKMWWSFWQMAAVLVFFQWLYWW